MPRLLQPIASTQKRTLLNMSFENQTITWLLQDGWQVFIPVVDHSHKTDILISDGQRYFRIQIKTVDGSKGKEQIVKNLWKEKPIDVVIYFARDGEWGYVAPAFSADEKCLNAPDHQFFMFKRREFLKAFHCVDL